MRELPAGDDRKLLQPPQLLCRGWVQSSRSAGAEQHQKRRDLVCSLWCLDGVGNICHCSPQGSVLGWPFPEPAHGSGVLRTKQVGLPLCRVTGVSSPHGGCLLALELPRTVGWLALGGKWPHTGTNRFVFCHPQNTYVVF